MTEHGASHDGARCIIASVVARMPAARGDTEIRVLCCGHPSVEARDHVAPNAGPNPGRTHRSRLYVAPMPRPEVMDRDNARRIELAGEATTSARRSIVASSGAIRANVVLVGPIEPVSGLRPHGICYVDESIEKRSLSTRKWVTEDQLEGTLRWLLTDAPEFMSGTVIPLDGGMNMGRYL